MTKLAADFGSLERLEPEPWSLEDEPPDQPCEPPEDPPDEPDEPNPLEPKLPPVLCAAAGDATVRRMTATRMFRARRHIVYPGYTKTRYRSDMELKRSVRGKRPRLGCVALSMIAVPCLACGAGYLVSTIPAPDPISREAVMTSFDAEERVATSMGFASDQTREAEHDDDDSPPDVVSLHVEAGECVAAIAAVWGFQHLSRLALAEQRGGGSRRVVSESEPEGAVGQVQWCTDRAATFAVTVERRDVDLYGRAGHTAAGVLVRTYRAPGSRIGGTRALKRGHIPDDALPLLSGLVMDAADSELTSGATPILAEPLAIETMSARLIPEDVVTYAELHRGARGRATRVVNPRFTPLPSVVPASWRPGVAPGTTRSMEALRAQVRPSEQPSTTHPAVRDTEDGFSRVLLVVDANRLGPRCVELQLVRDLYGQRATVKRAPAGRAELREVRSVENVAVDRICQGHGILVYVTPATDQARYWARLYDLHR